MSGEKLEIGADGLVTGVGEQQFFVLLPCPFCGGDASHRGFIGFGDTVSWVECDGCQIGTRVLEGTEICVEMWNKRAGRGAQDLANLLNEAITLLKMWGVKNVAAAI
jgi:Lar family restriction alleviation protein